MTTRSSMTTRSRISMVIYGLVNAVLFGVGAVTVLVFASQEAGRDGVD